MKTQSELSVGSVVQLNGTLTSFLRVSESRYMFVTVRDAGANETTYRLFVPDGGGYQLRLPDHDDDRRPLSKERAAQVVRDLKRRLQCRGLDSNLSDVQWRSIRRLNATNKDTVVFDVVITAKQDVRVKRLGLGDELTVTLRIGTWTNNTSWTLGTITGIVLPRY